MKNKKRLDVLLVEQGYADNRTKAQAIIMTGQVYVNDQKADKPGTAYEEVRGAACPYVSRGGLKLEKALRDFGVDPTGYVCSDSGASTGGFTDCLLQQGASKVFAIDVGYGQLDWKIRSDPRVVVMERTNVRYVTPEQLGEPLDLSVIDVSFISLNIVLPVIKTFLKPGKGQVLCALILYGVIFGGMLSGLGTETIREVFLPTQMEVIAGSYAMGVSSRQIFVEQCRQLLRTGDIYD